LCREEASDLEGLAARPEQPLNGFGIFGLVKEAGVDDEGLSVFYNDFFTRPLYLDKELTFYDALGRRKLGLSWNLWGVYRHIQTAMARLKVKNIEGNMKGEGALKGGIIIFDKNGKARYAYEEETGYEIPVDDILAAINKVKEESK